MQQGAENRMIIKKLKVKSFGKFKDFEIKFSPKLNIVYGENEAGKSTLQSFIKCMLYGMNSQKKSIRDNERKRFLPWSGEKAQGELIFLDNNKYEVIIKRSFGITKKEDESEIIDGITGENLKFIDTIAPGKDILNISEDSFEKTLYIKQLGSEVTKGREDEIMQKITNLSQAGEEDVSYEKAVKIIEDAKKVITTSRKNGKIDFLRDKLDRLNVELKESLSSSEGNIEDQLELNSLQDKKLNLKEDIEKLEIYKKHIKRIKLYKEYREITEYLTKTKELTEEKEKVAIDLDNGQNIIDEGFIDGLKQEYIVYNQIMQIYEDRKDHREFVEDSIEEKNHVLKNYNSFFGLEEDVDRKIIALNSERKSLEWRVEEFYNLEKEISKLQGDIHSVKETISNLSPLEGIRQEIDGILYSYEQSLKELKGKLDNSKLNYDILEKEEHIIKSKKAAVLAFTLSALISIAAFIFPNIYKLSSNLTYFYGAGSLSFIISIYNMWKLFKIKSTENQLLKEKNKEKDINKLHEKVENIEIELSKYFNMLGVKDYKDFVIAIKKYDEKIMEIEKLQIKMEEKEVQKENLKGEHLIEDLNKHEKYVNFILNHTESKDVEDFLNRYKTYKELVKDIESLHKEKEIQDSSLNHLQEEIDLKEKLIIERIRQIDNRVIPMEEVEEQINKLYNKLKEKRNLEHQIKSVESNYKLLLKDRDLDFMRQEIGDILKEDVQEDFKDEDAIDEAIKIKNSELLNVEKRLKDVQNSINNRFLGKRAPSDIEEDIEHTKDEIKDLEENLEVLNIALYNLSQCFREIQKNYVPLLNQRVTDIFQNVTFNKYEDIKIDENYNIKLRDSNENNMLQADYLSNGTLDQVYFALRMALVDLIYDKDIKVPIILDDAFIQYDDERLKETLELLNQISFYRQIIIFTCQRREENILKSQAEIIKI